MRITYKDVGQGDSILLEWESEGAKKIGIIDCNLKGKSNPVLTHIKSHGYSEIEFIILSHPHRDHYSGMLGLLNYCEESGIVIKQFAHTLILAGNTKFWKYFEVSSKDSRQLNTLIKKWRVLKEAGTILRMVALIDGKPLKISEEILLECLAPSHEDAEEYQKVVMNDADKNIKEASQAANHLSTVFKLSSYGCNALLTSDAENYALEGVIDRQGTNLSKDKFHLCQLPHHGSINNHYPSFWNMIQTSPIKYAIISAGKHRTYNHPSFSVIRAFHADGYSVHCTNILNGMEEYTNYLRILKEACLEFDSCSTLAEEYRKSSDRVFVVEHGELKMLNE